MPLGPRGLADWDKEQNLIDLVFEIQKLRNWTAVLPGVAMQLAQAEYRLICQRKKSTAISINGDRPAGTCRYAFRDIFTQTAGISAKYQ